MDSAYPPNIYQSPNDHIAKNAIELGAKLEAVPAGHVLLRQGDTAEYLYVLRRGMVAAVIEKCNKKLTLDVFLDGYVFTAMESFCLSGSSAFALEMVTDSEYVAISPAILQSMVADSRVRAELGIHHQLTNMRMTRRLIELMTISPLERYVQFLRERPDLAGRLPQYMIASMLGISPESLSRVRKRLAKNHR